MIDTTKVSTLIFDLGNVIIPLKDERHWWEEVFKAPFSDKVAIDALRKSGFFARYEAGQINDDAFLGELEQYLLPDRNREDIVQGWLALLGDLPEKRIKELRKLSERFRLLLLSNTNEIHLDYISRRAEAQFGSFVLDEVFGYCYYSHRIRLAKPDVAIYEYVLAQERLSAGEVIFLDDKPDNLDGAVKAGIIPLHISPSSEFADILRSEAGIVT